jgi:8-oxo-dGTP diphosphatase
MTTTPATRRRVYFNDPLAPPAETVVPAAFAAVRGAHGRLLLVQRCDSGVWELPGGHVEVGESALDAALRETAEESGLTVRIIGLVGLYTDPGQVVHGVDGEVRQQFAVVFRAEVDGGGVPHPDGVETSAVAWVAAEDVAEMAIEPAMRIRIDHALSTAGPHLG